MNVARGVREELYERLMAEAEEGLRRYYAEYPERANDLRSADAIAWSQRGLRRVLRCLDEYDFKKKTEKTPP